MIEIKRFEGSDPAIAYTDFSKIYISNIVTRQDEYYVLYKHESSHIWLQHQLRAQTLYSVEKEKFNHNCWNQAADLEIAHHIYDKDDEEIINRPRSCLQKGISKKDLKRYPDCTYAEDFYYKLLNDPLEKSSHDENINHKTFHIENDEDQQQLSRSTKEALINLAKKKLEDFKKGLQKQYISEKTNHFLPKASLSTEIDKHLGRVALARVKSYKRPNRREEGDFIRKGMVSKQTAPRVLIYLDRSASFCEQKTRKANKKLDEILMKYRTKIEKDVIFFHDHLFYEEPRSSGGTNYIAVCEDIAASLATLAIVITDDDYCDVRCAKILEKSKTNILIIPVGCATTKLRSTVNAREVLV